MKNKDKIQEARNYASKINHEIANLVLNDDYDFADHVTLEEKKAFAEKHRTLAKEIKQGLHDGNFTVWQRMHYFLTGNCVQFLPN